MAEAEAETVFSGISGDLDRRRKARKELELRKDALHWRDYLSELSGVPRPNPENPDEYRFTGDIKSDVRPNGLKDSAGSPRVVSDYGHFSYEERFFQLFPGRGPEKFVVIELSCIRKAEELAAKVISDMRSEGFSAESVEDVAALQAEDVAANREITNFLASEVLTPKGFAFSAASKEYPHGFFYRKLSDEESESYIESNDAMNVIPPLWRALDSYESLFFTDKSSVEEVFLKGKSEEKRKDEERGFAVSEWRSRKTGKTFDNIDFPEREPTDEETEFLLGEGFRKGWRDGGKTYFSKESSGRREEFAETIGRLEKLSHGRNGVRIDKDTDMNQKENFEESVLNGAGKAAEADVLGDEVPFDGPEAAETARGNRTEFSIGKFQHWNFLSGQTGKMLDMVAFSSQADTDAMTSFMSERGYKKSNKPTHKHPFGTFYADYDGVKSESLESELKVLHSLSSEKSVSAAEAVPSPSAGGKGVFAEWSYRNYSFISFVGENGAENTEAEAELMKSRGYVRAVEKDGAFKTTPKNPNGWYFSNMKTKEDELRRDGLISELAIGGYSREVKTNERGARGQNAAATESAEPEPETPEKDIKVETWEFSGKTGKFCCAAVASEEVTKSVTNFMTDSENGFRFSDKTSEHAPHGYFYRSVNTPEREAEAWGTIAELRDLVPEVQKSIEKENARKAAEQAAARTETAPAKTNSDEKGNKTMSFDYQEYTDGDGKRWGNIYLHGKASDAVRKRLKSLGLVDCGTNSRGNHHFGKIIEQDYQQAQMQEALAYLNAYQRPEGIGMPESPVLGGAEPESRDASGRPAASATIQNFYSEAQKRSYLNVYFDKDPGAEAKQAMANCGLTFNGKTRPRWWSRDVADTPELRESVDKALGELGIARQYKLTAAGDKTSEISASRTGGVKFNHEITVLENGSNASFFVFSERPGAAVTSQLKEAGYTFVAARTARDGSFVPSCWHKSGVGKETAEGLEKKFSQTMAKASGADVSKMQETSRAAEKQQVQQRKNGRGR